MDNTNRMPTKKDYQRVAASFRDALLAGVDACTAPAVQAPAALRERIFAQIATHARREKRLRRVRNIAAALIVILLTAGITLTVNTQARDALLHWIKQHTNKRVVFFFEGADKTAPLKEYALADIPEGFSLYDSFKTETRSYVCYLTEDMAGMIAFDYCYESDGGALTIQSFSDEPLVMEEVTVNGLPGEFYKDGDDANGNVLLWFDVEEGIVFMLTSTFDKDTMLMFAESIYQP